MTLRWVREKNVSNRFLHLIFHATVASDTMKTPSDHITVHYPMTSPVRRHTAAVWRRARPSRAMAYMVLLFLTTDRGTRPNEIARLWLHDLWSSARLTWQATMAAIFGSNWLRRPDERISMIRDASEHARQAIVQREPEMMSPFILAMVGQVPLRRLIELIRENPAQWNRDRPEISALPGAPEFLQDIDRILEGRADEVSWAVPASTAQSSHVQGVTDRNVRSLRPGDAIILDPMPRMMSLSELLRRARAIALRCSDDRRLFTVETVEFPEPERFCVAIHRRS